VVVKEIQREWSEARKGMKGRRDEVEKGQRE
jgi:hypothetical protein